LFLQHLVYTWMEVMETIPWGFRKLGCTNLEVMDIRNRKKMLKKASTSIDEESRFVSMFSGGDSIQNWLKYIGQDGKIHDIILEPLSKEHFVIAERVPVAMCMSLKWNNSGSSTEAICKRCVNMGQGMKFFNLVSIQLIHIHSSWALWSFGRSRCKIPKIKWVLD